MRSRSGRASSSRAVAPGCPQVGCGQLSAASKPSGSCAAMVSAVTRGAPRMGGLPNLWRGMENGSTHLPRVLSIAGSDSGGGAGVQADLKAFARCGVHGMTAITAITAQSTVAVDGVWPVAPEAIVAQVRAVAHDIGVDAMKIGMLGSAETIAAVDEALDLLPGVPIVLDPVMVAESGSTLLDDNPEHALRERLLPRTTVATPNV